MRIWGRVNCKLTAYITRCYTRRGKNSPDHFHRELSGAGPKNTEKRLRDMMMCYFESTRDRVPVLVAIRC